jgi:RsiW-degrading membrane proteinase PrsW (M82 family)
MKMANPINYCRTAKASLLSPAALAQVQWTSVQDFKNAAGTIAGLITIVAWVLAIIAWFVGVSQKEQNPSAAKFCFFLVWMFAIGVPVVSLLFYIFIGAEGTPSPSFK